MKRLRAAVPVIVLAVVAAGLTVGSPASAATSYDVPLTSWAYLDSQSPGTFEFSGGTPGIVSFTWQIDDGPSTDLPADSQGKATITYTPAQNFQTYTLSVTGHKADGTDTDVTRYYIYVANGG
ncbi:hypothetical protein ACWIF8_17605 [Micromonospora chalcea]